MKLRDVLGLPSMSGTRLVAGRAGLDRDVRWSHVVDMPDPARWIRPGFMLLMSGYSWPQDVSAQHEQIRALDSAGVSAIGMAVPKYADHFSEEARREADRIGVPLLEVPWETPFAQIMEELHRAVMAEPYDIIARSEHIHRALTRAAISNAGLEDLARSLCSLIGRSVTFEDPAGKLLAHCSTSEHAHAPGGMMRALADQALITTICGTEKPVRVPAMPQFDAPARVVCPIRIGSQLAGLVWIIEGDLPLSELDHRAAEHAALVAAIHIAHQRELASVEARLGYASFLSLLESKPGETPVAEERARLLGFDSNARYRVGIVIVPEELPLGREGVLRRDRVALRVREALRAIGAAQLVTVKLDQVPFLLPEGVRAEEIHAALDEPGVSLVFGRVHGGAAGARESYHEALSLIPYRHRGTVCYYEDLLVPRVIMGDPAARDSFLHELFEPLRSRKGGANLTRALLTLARSGFRFGETAVTLGIHPNTLRYRLERARTLLAIDLDDPDVRFRLQLASRLLDLQERSW